ncbi:uncharacterized protein B0T15DRAFT_123948 [Chaetomium strumarium]|uniref:C2H2-type domain-containing protein n=1 Tax=Chaetomium strumarium TaxID=1170767 RepID=A0AAJ0H038_9PEZI|nr:hypothetical protein B0T15DRAFT_123948 [Chaetomium strumarium]
MSVAYQPRTYFNDGGYPPMDGQQPMDSHPALDNHHPMDGHHQQLPAAASEEGRHADTGDALVNVLTNAATTTPEDEPATAVTAPRRKAIPKPDREVTRNASGMFVCTWPDCSDQIKEFKRRCEWDKHMDKHERPYKCPEKACERVLGFTYPGGLSRHMREVHLIGLDDNERLYCTEQNCKRNVGKGKWFTRQENLDEHLHRVHGIDPKAKKDSREGSQTHGSDQNGNDAAAAGQKRKRADDSDLRDEVKRLREENDRLLKQLNEHMAMEHAMKERMQALEQQLNATTVVASPETGYQMTTAPPTPMPPASQAPVANASLDSVANAAQEPMVETSQAPMADASLIPVAEASHACGANFSAFPADFA